MTCAAAGFRGMPLADQRRYGDAFRRLLELQDALTALGPQ